MCFFNYGEIITTVCSSLDYWIAAGCDVPAQHFVVLERYIADAFRLQERFTTFGKIYLQALRYTLLI